MEQFLFFVLIGFISGAISAMGFGGGSILILLLTGFLGVAQIKAQGINLFYFIPVAALSLVFHFRCGSVDKKAAGRAILLGVIGALAGAFLATFFQNTIPLRKMFAVMVLCLGIWELFRPAKKECGGK